MADIHHGARMGTFNDYEGWAFIQWSPSGLLHIITYMKRKHVVKIYGTLRDPKLEQRRQERPQPQWRRPHAEPLETSVKEHVK